MYNDDVLRIPTNEDDLWVLLREQFEYARMILWDSPVETREDALAGTYRRKPKGSPIKAIRYRDTSHEYDNREHFLEIGSALLPYIDQAIDQRQFTPEFVQQWGKFMFCHGYLASYYFEDSDDLGHHRAGRVRTRDTQRKWVAKFMIALVDGQGLRRQQAQELIEGHIEEVVRSKAFPNGFDRDWFRKVADTTGLRSTYDLYPAHAPPQNGTPAATPWRRLSRRPVGQVQRLGSLPDDQSPCLSIQS